MKNIFKTIISSLLLVLVVSCAGEDDKMTLVENTKSSLSADKTSVVLNNAVPDDEAIEFIYSLPTFSPLVVPQYFIEFGIKGNNFYDSEVLVVSKDAATISITHKELNDLMLNLGAEAGQLTAVEVRFKASFNSNANYYSNVLSLDITPFVSLKDLFLVGDATEAGWGNNNNNQPLFRDPVNVNKFYFRGYFSAGSFKILEKLGEWHPQWGLNAGAVAVSNLDGSNEPGSFSISAAGYYDFEIDINAKTYSLTPYTGSLASYSTIGIIGSSTADGWNSDQDMTASTFNPHVWRVNNIALTAGEAKFRADNDWGANWGGNTPFSGTATSGGPNIPVSEAANYDVFFNDLDGRYLFIKK